jgi:hypothetical protein
MNIVCPEGIMEGCLITKEKRQEQYGRVAGGSGSTLIENYQRKQIEVGTGFPCPKTHRRINWRTNTMEKILHPMTEENGFDYTEDFDGKQIFDSTRAWINLKCVVGTGGSQTRTLRDQCYTFVEAQLHYLLKTEKTNYLFVNILDGDEAASVMSKFKYLLNLSEYSSVKQYVYVGDLKGYFPWVKSILAK